MQPLYTPSKIRVCVFTIPPFQKDAPNSKTVSYKQDNRPVPLEIETPAPYCPQPCIINSHTLQTHPKTFNTAKKSCFRN